MAKLFVFLLITLAGWMGVASSMLLPHDATKSLLNLDFEVRWLAPSDENNKTMYTVEYSHNRRKWYNMPRCTDIQRTECTNMTQSLLELFPQHVVEDAVLTGFKVRVYRHDGPLAPASPFISVDFSPYSEATIGAPAILKLDATLNSQRVGLVAPQTPFPDGATGKYILMDDRNLGGVSKVYYNYTLWRIPYKKTDTTRWTMEERRDDVPAKRPRGINFTDLTLPDLVPNTEYALTVQARIGTERYSVDTTTMAWRTREAVPSEGPTLYPLEFVEVDCSNPDSRDIRVKWKSPPRSKWNGDSLFYEVRFSRPEPSGEHVTLNVTSSTSTIIYDLSRWDRYDVVVFANTTAGGKESSPKPLPATVVGMANSEPETIRLLTNPFKSAQVIAWQPPSGYKQCILGYRVTLSLELGGMKGVLKKEETVINGTEFEIGSLVPRTYTVEVAAIVKTGFNATSLGMTGNIRLVAEPVRNINGIITSVIVVSGLIVFILIVITYRTINKTCKDERFQSLTDNKILKRASSQAYSSLRRYVPEMETYDLLNQPEALERETSSTSRDSGVSKQTNSSGYSTDTKSGAADDIFLSDNDGGKVPANDVVFTSWLKQFFSLDEGAKNSVFVDLLEVSSNEETNQRDCAVFNQSSSRAPTCLVSPPDKYSVTLASGYTPVSSCCPSRQTSVDEDSSACRKTSRVSYDSTQTSPYLENYPTGCGLKYTVLASMTQCHSQPHPLAKSGEKLVCATSDASDTNNNDRAALKNNLSSQDSEIDTVSKSLLV